MQPSDPGPRAAAQTAPTTDADAVFCEWLAGQMEDGDAFNVPGERQANADHLREIKRRLLAGRAPAPTEAEAAKLAQLEDDATRLDWLHRRLGGLPTSVSEALFGYWDWMDVREAIDRAMQEDL